MENSPGGLLAMFAPVERHDEHISRARVLLERAIRQRWAEGLLSRDGDSSYAAPIGSSEVERLMSATPGTRGKSMQAAVEDHAYDPHQPIGELGLALGLAPSECDLLAVLLACETDPTTARLAAYLSGVNAGVAITVDTLFEVVYRPRTESTSEASALLHTDLAPEHAARRLRFLIVDGADSRPFLAQTVRLHPRMTNWLLGRRTLAPELAASAQLIIAEPPIEQMDPTKIEAARRALDYGGRLLHLRGVTGSGRELLLRTVAYQQKRPLLLVSGRGLDANLVVAAFREALLHDAVLAFREADEVLGGDAGVRFRESLAVFRGTVTLMGLDRMSNTAGALRVLLEVDVPTPPHTERLRLWQTHLGPSALTDKEWRDVSGLYNLGVGGIVQACERARELASIEEVLVTRGHITQAVRSMFDGDLLNVAKRVEVTQTWDDVVLPPELLDALHNLTDRIAFRSEVLGDWGFARKVGKGLGLTALFSGPPGTGKSMVAGLIARDLGLDLYVVDLSRVTSKWLGETEKNLARAFDAAEAGHVLLLFDEADTVLGKRSTKMDGANDRHANLETNFILSRLEQFQGIALFTTNIPSAIDEAIMRRMSAHIAFPFPDVEARAELWRRMIPREAPVAERIDFTRFARDFEITGGYIRNVVLRAAYLAARDKVPLSAVHFQRAVRGEYTERGALTVGGRLT